VTFDDLAIASDGTFKAALTGNRTQRGFCGPGHAEAAGVFEQANIVGAFGAKLDPLPPFEDSFGAKLQQEILMNLDDYLVENGMQPDPPFSREAARTVPRRADLPAFLRWRAAWELVCQ